MIASRPATPRLSRRTSAKGTQGHTVGLRNLARASTACVVSPRVSRWILRLVMIEHAALAHDSPAQSLRPKSRAMQMIAISFEALPRRGST
jgi:hypothetical protein